MINTITPLLVSEIYESYVTVDQYNVHRMIFTLQVRKRGQFENRVFWSIIELFLFRPGDNGEAVTTMINTITPLLVLGICDAYVAVVHYNVHRMIFMSQVWVQGYCTVVVLMYGTD